MRAPIAILPGVAWRATQNRMIAMPGSTTLSSQSDVLNDRSSDNRSNRLRSITDTFSAGENHFASGQGTIEDSTMSMSEAQARNQKPTYSSSGSSIAASYSF